MKKLTIPKAILLGFCLIAISIASVPYSNLIIKPAYALSNVVIMNQIISGQKRIIEEIRKNCN